VIYFQKYRTLWSS